MLAIFREGRCHLALVTEDPISAMRCMAEGKRPSSERCNVIGIVTLEDVIEEILQGKSKKWRIHLRWLFLIISFVVFFLKRSHDYSYPIFFFLALCFSLFCASFPTFLFLR